MLNNKIESEARRLETVGSLHRAVIANVRHFPRVIKGFVATSNQPTILIRGHDVFVVAINDIFHGKLIAQLIGIRIATGGIHRKGNADERKTVAGRITVSGIVTFGIATFTIVAMKGAEIGSGIRFVIVATTQQLRRQLSLILLIGVFRALAVCNNVIEKVLGNVFLFAGNGSPFGSFLILHRTVGRT
jgi:hypothetical protein